MRILADADLYGVEALFSPLGEVQLADGRDLRPAQLRGIDALLVRSVTRVDAALLRDYTPAFVGTATAGVDHVDVELLRRRGAAFANAPGANAAAVADYALSAIANCDDYLEQLLAGDAVGIIGYGQVGRRLAARLDALGIKWIAYDPWVKAARDPQHPQPESTTDLHPLPAANPQPEPAIAPPQKPARDPQPEPDAEPRLKSAADSRQEFATTPQPEPATATRLEPAAEPQVEPAAPRISELSAVLGCLVVCVHASLTRAPPWPSAGLIGAAELAAMRPDALLLNAARGEILRQAELLEAAARRRAPQLALDVWENEPAIDPALLARCRFATPHIAGYSLDAKFRAAAILRRALCAARGLAPRQAPPPLADHGIAAPPQAGDAAFLRGIINQCYDIRADDAALRAAPQEFDRLRQNYFPPDSPSGEPGRPPNSRRASGLAPPPIPAPSGSPRRAPRRELAAARIANPGALSPRQRRLAQALGCQLT